MQQLRSWLFVPANRADRVAKAFAGDADAVVMDLEDACPADEKASARANVADAATAHGGRKCYVRINAAATPLALADLEAVVLPGMAGVMLPKAEVLADLHTVDWVMGQLEARHGLPSGSIELIPLIESGLGVIEAAALARAGLPRIRRLTFGAGDLSLDLGARWTTDEAELAWTRQVLVTASRAGGLESPIDTVWPGLSDQEGFVRSAERARDLGFAGKLLIHPGQIEPAHAVFTPDPAAVDHARRVLAAAAEAEAEGHGAFRLDGRLMDNVSVVRARRVLAAIGEAQ